MAFANMAFEIAGEFNVPMPLAQTKINEALGDIYDEQMWSFQLGEAGWLTPGLLFAVGSPASQSLGTITANAFSNIVVGDATAAAQWQTYNNSGQQPFLTSLQIRQPYYSLYNIINFDGVNTFTLDRLWMEPSGVGLTYMIYQAYFAVPDLTFKRFFEIRDTTNNAPMDYWTFNRTDLAVLDGQRTLFVQPGYVVPYETDQRPGSPTFGNMLYELWNHPLSQLPYTISYLRRGALLVKPTDTVPSPLTDEMVKWKAKEAVYLWKEGQKGDGVARGSGADFKFLAGAAKAEYENKRRHVVDRDRDLVNLYFMRFVRDAATGYSREPFATITGGLNVGRF